MDLDEILDDANRKFGEMVDYDLKSSIYEFASFVSSVGMLQADPRLISIACVFKGMEIAGFNHKKESEAVNIDDYATIAEIFEAIDSLPMPSHEGQHLKGFFSKQLDPNASLTPSMKGTVIERGFIEFVSVRRSASGKLTWALKLDKSIG